MNKTLVDAAGRGDVGLLEQTLSGRLGGMYGAERPDREQALLRAAMHGETAAMQRLFADGDLDPDCIDIDGDTPLMLASANNKLQVVKLLVDAGADIDLQSDRQRTALHMAVWSEHERIVDYLLEEDCELDIQEQYGDTALMMAARRGYDSIAHKLLDDGSTLDIRSHEHETALHYAAKDGHTQCATLLIQYGAQIDPKTKWGHTPLLLAAMGSHGSTTLLLLYAGADFFVTDRANRSVLQHMAQTNLVECARYVLSIGGDPNSQDDDGITPFLEAVRKGHYDMARMLILHGCSVRTVAKTTVNGGFQYWSTLDIALCTGDVELVELTITAGVGGVDLQTSLEVNNTSGEARRKLMEWVLARLSAPLSLAEWCRLSLRTRLGTDYVSILKQLQLPKSIESFMMFQ